MKKGNMFLKIQGPEVICVRKMNRLLRSLTLTLVSCSLQLAQPI